MTVCPYCNRQYISYFAEDTKTTADLDHFYPKSLFSLFALSLYNFVPSCQVCNQRFKKQKVKKILYPFQHDFGKDAYFDVEINDVKAYYQGSDDFKIKLRIDNTSKIKEEITNNNKMFQLESLYQHHKPYVQGLMIEKGKVYIDQYLNMMKKTFKNLHLSKEQLDLFLYGISHNEDIDKNIPLTKLTKDILKK